MSREQAETYLRLLAESELRDLTGRPADGVLRSRAASKLKLAARALCAVGAVDPRTAWQIRAEADLALAARQPGQAPSVPGRRSQFLPPPPVPPQPAQFPPPGGSPAGRLVPWRVVPVGRMIVGPVQAGDLTLLAFLQGPAGARFAIAGGMPGFPGQLTATDDQGARYHLRLMRGSRTGVLELLPAPVHPIRWLELLTASGEIAAHIDLDDPPASRAPAQAEVTTTAASAGELMLEAVAARILASAPVRRPDLLEPPDSAPPELRALVADKPGRITTALLAAGVLSPASPRPGQLAALCERLGMPGHGITAPAAAGLPEPWAAMLARRAGPRSALAPGTWATADAGPELGGTRLTLLGLQQGAVDTILHTLVSGVTPDDEWEFGTGIRPLRAMWVRASDGGWHATRTIGVLPWSDADVVLHSLTVIPPLPAGTAWIDVLTIGPGAEAQLRLTLVRP